VPELSDAIFRELLQAAPDAIVLVDSAGRIVLVNARTERLFGYTSEELVDQPVELLVPESARSMHPSWRAGYVAEPFSRPMGAGVQLTARRRDGSEFPAEISLSALRTNEGMLVSAAVRDVSERIEAQSERDRLKSQAERERIESELHQSQRLESLGQLAGGVAHDFNNLIAVIVNYAAFIRDEATANIAIGVDMERWEVVRQDVAQIERAGERATRLTHQLLSFARRKVVRPEVIDLNRVVGEVEELLRRTIGEHVELVVSLAPQLSPVLADPGQIEQVLLNLALNARDAMQTGGVLTIDTQNVVVDALYAQRHPGLATGTCVRTRVSDTGEGMTQEVIDRAFEPFFTSKPRGEGSGLGLATVHGIINQAGGHVHIYSEPGIGTTVTALLPAIDDTVAAPEAPAPARPVVGVGVETILVVEDEAAMREVTRRMLARSGYSVLTAANGHDALTIAREHADEIQLLITDVIMPHMLGKEVAEQIRVMRPDLPVVFMSGYAEPILATQGTLEPGVTLLEKPFSEQVLLAKIRGVLDGQSSPSSRRRDEAATPGLAWARAPWPAPDPRDA
jgi:PAS domain S-box-containing protein